MDTSTRPDPLLAESPTRSPRAESRGVPHDWARDERANTRTELDSIPREEQALLRLVVVGSVDDGKSTLIGRLLYEAHGLYEDQISSVRRATRQAGEEIDFSLFTDGLRAEREQGITIDVAYRSFATPRRRFIVADTPGHVQYTRNMATGASTAEVAVILIDARLGILAQSRRHAYLARLLGVRHLAVVINKIDLVEFDQGVFERIRAQFAPFVEKLGFTDVRFFPVSAKAGDNVVTPSARTNWYRDGTLLDFLETVPLGESDENASFRFPVQYVIRPDLGYRGFAGQITSGEVAVDDEVVVLPSGQKTRVLGIDTFDGPLARAFAPMSVALRLADEVDVGRGDLLVAPSSMPTVVQELEATVVWLSERPLNPTRKYWVQHTSRLVPANLERVHWRMNLETLEPEPTDSLGFNDVGRVSVRCLRPICVDSYSQARQTGAFIVIDALTNDTVAAGIVASRPSTPLGVNGGEAGLGVNGGEAGLGVNGGGRTIALEDHWHQRLAELGAKRGLGAEAMLKIILQDHIDAY